jgi:UrcA family protein
MSNFITKLTTAGYLVLASVPVAGLAVGVAHAAPAAHVQIGDLNLASSAGMATFKQRVQAAGQQICRDERSLSGRESCTDGVRAEAQDKLAAVIASRSTTLAAR